MVRFVKLDLARFLAALFVLIYHLPAVPRQVIGWAWLSVDFFFVLSGFVLFPSIRNSKIRSVFLRKRALRLWTVALPPLIVLMASLFMEYIWEILVQDEGSKPALTEAKIFDWVCAVLLVQLIFPSSLYWIHPLWSLSVEWWVNVFVVLTRLWSNRIFMSTIICSGFILGMTTVFLRNNFANYLDNFLILEFARGLTGFLVGIILRLAFEGNGFRGFRSKPYLAFSAILLVIALNNYLPLFVLPISYCFFCIIILSLTDNKNFNSNTRIDGLFLWAGRQSFGIYVWHIATLELILFARVPFFDLHWSLQLTSLLLLTLVLSEVSARLCEPKVRSVLAKAFRTASV